MDQFIVRPVGRISADRGRFAIEIAEPYREALEGLEGFSWINVIWWADQLDNPEARAILSTEKPYRKGPERLGIFATRSPARPNPILVTAIMVSGIDARKGIIETPYIDAENGTPVLDLKPYHGSTDRVDNWRVPEWCGSWPENIEASGEFAWHEVFNF